MINARKEGLGHAIYNGPLREQFHPLIITTMLRIKTHKP